MESVEIVGYAKGNWENVNVLASGLTVFIKLVPEQSMRSNVICRWHFVLGGDAGNRSKESTVMKWLINVKSLEHMSSRRSAEASKCYWLLYLPVMIVSFIDS